MSNYYVPDLDLPEGYMVAAFDNGSNIGYTYALLLGAETIETGLLTAEAAARAAHSRAMMLGLAAWEESKQESLRE